MVVVVASVGRITAGIGYDYLTREVATSKHDYYTGKGEAPGVWAGRGSALIGLSGEVDADDMAALYGRFAVPSTAGGTRLPSGRWLPEQILGRRVSAKTHADGTVAEPVAAFDVTFSPSKSVSLMWGLIDNPEIRNSVVEAHEAAVSAALEYLDQTAGHTRAGDGGIRKVLGDGFIIAQFRHRTSRSTKPGERVGDPQLHSHCAILNRVRGVDGKWRTLDSRAIYRHAHAAGAVYGALLERELTERLGVSWQDPGKRVPMREIAGVPESLIAEFSSRRAQVLDHYDRLADEWRQIHGRTPTKAERATMLDQATVRSRHRKSGAPVDLHAQWRVAATVDDLAALAHTVPGADIEATSPVDGGRLPAGSDELAGRVFAELHEQRSWWTRAHVTSEVARLIADPTPEAIEVETERLIEKCVPLEVDTDPAYADAHAAKYTSPTIRDAEQRVLNAADHDSATFTVETVRDPMLGDDQVAAVDEIASGDGRIATVVGPAGAGKTTMLRSVAASYHHGERKVAVLTLSAVAARVVRDETGLDAHTIASWRVGQVDIPRRGLVIVDEASMVPTLVLDELVRVADIYRSKVALIGDYAQMGAPEAGGLLRDLAARPAAVELTAVRRFRNQWEADASLMLRSRQPSIASTYDRQGRISEATNDTVFDRAAAAWWADTAAGNTALIVVDTADDAADVSTRCQRHLIVDGRLGERVATAVDGCRIHIGDQIQTRRNTTDITTSDRQRVLNRDAWTVLEHHDDGSLTVAHTSRPARAVLPADYVASDVVLAYATTIAGAQGRTVDRGHAVVTPRTTSASLYVGMTRGRECNHAHVVTDSHDHAEFELGDLTGQQAFAKAIVRDPEGQLSADAVAQRWNATANERARARTLDRQRQHVVRWWDSRYRSLPPRMQTALADHHHRIIDHLMTAGTDAERGHLLNNAAGATDWRTPTATADFFNRLRLLDRANAAGTAPPSPAAVRRFER